VPKTTKKYGKYLTIPTSVGCAVEIETKYSDCMKFHRKLEKIKDMKVNTANIRIDNGINIGCAGIRKANIIIPIFEMTKINGIEFSQTDWAFSPFSKMVCSVAVLLKFASTLDLKFEYIFAEIIPVVTKSVKIRSIAPKSKIEPL